MKFLVTSDNHLGYKENDHIRSNDSFTTFEEILQLATTNEVDFIIQGGDLFHENTPTRSTLLKTIELFKNYCFGNKKIEFESNTILNYDDPNLNISIPVLAIHGNHDDPTGVKSKSALDILSSAGLVNYIGKTKTIEYLNIDPVIFKKKNIKIAIYGVGYIKDRTIYKLFKEKKVNFNRPDDYEDYINILVVHQNRVRRSSEDYLPVDFIDDWFDLVIYGHEHDPQLVKVDSKDFIVMQCGSTIRTSLSEGEMGEKYAYIINVDDNINIKKHILGSVRPLIIKTLKISNQEIEKADLIVKKEVDDILKEHNNTMPLIRLRLDINSIINRSKFGLLFKDRVANYKEIISFIRRNKNDNKKENQPTKEMKDVLKMFMDKIELKAIPEYLFVEGVKKFSECGDKDIFKGIVRDTVQNIVNKIPKTCITINLLETQIKNIKNNVNKENKYYNDIMKP